MHVAWLSCFREATCADSQGCDSAMGLAPREAASTPGSGFLSCVSLGQSLPSLLKSSPRSTGLRCPSKLRMTLFCPKTFLTSGVALFFHAIRDALIHISWNYCPEGLQSRQSGKLLRVFRRAAGGEAQGPSAEEARAAGAHLC